MGLLDKIFKKKNTKPNDSTPNNQISPQNNPIIPPPTQSNTVAEPTPQKIAEPIIDDNVEETPPEQPTEPIEKQPVVEVTPQEKLQQQIEQFKQKNAEDYVWLDEMSFDIDSRTISFSIFLNDNFIDGSITIPEKRGEPIQATFSDQFIEEPFEENIQDNIASVFHMVNAWTDSKRVNKESETEGTEDENVLYLSDDDEGKDYQGEAFYNNQAIIAVLTEDIKKLNTPGLYAELGSSGKDHVKLHMLLDPTKKSLRNILTNLVAGAWGVDLHQFIGMTVTFFTLFTEQQKIPTVSVYQCGDVTSKNFKTQFEVNKKNFGLYWTLEHRVREDVLPLYYPFDEKLLKMQKQPNFVEKLFQGFEDALLSCNKRCLICGVALSYEGLKPCTCENPLCIFSRENYGLGLDIGTELENNLLMTMTCAASSAPSEGKFNPFEPFPGIEVQTKQKVHSFFTGNNKKDNSAVYQVINRIPSVETLRDWHRKGGLDLLKSKMDDIDVLAFPLLRWVVSSNRSHLKKLEKNEMVSQMNTTHQYLLMSSTPEKEKRFQALKKKHGSFYAFHGSALSNWHSILRTGLKNMSGTSGQVNGAAYGSGVYLAANSSVSFSYMRYAQGWKNSQFGNSNLACLSMVEVIDDVKKPNPYYVIPNEDLLMTRYFFFYAGSGTASVEGKSIPTPKVH